MTGAPPPPPRPPARGRWPWPCSRNPGRCWRWSRARVHAFTQTLVPDVVPSQLQDLSEGTGITIEFDRRIDILQSGVRTLVAGTRPPHAQGATLIGLLPHHPRNSTLACS